MLAGSTSEYDRHQFHYGASIAPQVGPWTIDGTGTACGRWAYQPVRNPTLIWGVGRDPAGSALGRDNLCLRVGSFQ